MAGVDTQRFDVAVIGAGFAGLSAAARLARGGARVLVLEARARLGGRATAFPDRVTGDLVDNGQHILLGCYTDTFSFLREIGAADNVRAQPQLAVSMIDRQGRRSRLSCPPLPPPLHLLSGVMDWSALSWRDRLSLAAMMRPLANARRELLGKGSVRAASPGETVEDWLIRNGQTPRVREMLWDPLALAALNQSPREAAAPPFTRVLAEMFGPDPKAAAIALPTRPLHLMYAEPARAYIEARRGVVMTGSPAGIAMDGDRLVDVRTAERQWHVGAVIAAVPWFALADLFERTPTALTGIVERAAAMAASPIVSVNLWLDRDVIPELNDVLSDVPFVGLPGRTMQWLFDKRAVFGDTSAHVSLVSSGAAAIVAKTNDELIALAHRELIEAMPALRAGKLLRGTVVRERRATFSLAPGQPARPAAETGVRGFFLAGDWIDTGLPATIESAVRSGHLAAELARRT